MCGEHTAHVYIPSGLGGCRRCCACRDSVIADALLAGEAGKEDMTPAEAALKHAAQHAALRRRAKHHAMLASLSGTAPAFPASAQLASRWVAAHMLSNHITEPISELLTAAGFAAADAACPPGKLLHCTKVVLEGSGGASCMPEDHHYCSCASTEACPVISHPGVHRLLTTLVQSTSRCFGSIRWRSCVIA